MNDTEITLRVFEPRDSEKVIDFFTRLSENTIRNYTRFGFPLDIDSVKKHLSWVTESGSEMEKIFIAIVGDKVVGLGHLTFFQKTWKKHVCTLGIVIEDGWQGKGIGKSIMNYMISFAKQKGIKKVWLSVYADNLRARQLYEKMGFVVEGIFINEEIFGGVARHVISMALFLDETYKPDKTTG
ncbi:MAG: GNAT family N-acetyltransferase [Aigarchaeota archaeon]|nr:GNAT family N-acetyltransferase [Aigarchaeota archaeon]MDW8092656.1 GNAT family N-acetyltransferase [Nitrososphaerota archaeon]